MAFFASSRPVADGVFGRSLGFSISDVFARLVAWNDQRVTLKELSKLTDRELNDIGLSRSDIASVVSGLR
jgi:uncharacterized protein YjiS (DUF1127 family)